MNKSTELCSSSESLTEWPYESCASPATKVEVCAKLYGFASVAGTIPEGPASTANLPTQLIAEATPSPDLAPAAASGSDYFHVNREAKFAKRSKVENRKPSRVEGSPKGSLEHRVMEARRLEFVAAGLASAITMAWISKALRAPGPSLDWAGGFAFLFLLLPAVFGLIFLALDALYGWGTGRIARDRKYMEYMSKMYPIFRQNFQGGG